MRARSVRIWTRWQQDRAQRGADRIAAKNDVLKQMNHWLLELADRHAVGPAEDIQAKADTLWRTRSNRQTRKLQSYFLRILPNLSQAQRQAIQETLRQVSGASAIKTALTAALQSPAASQHRRAISVRVRHALSDGVSSLRSQIAVRAPRMGIIRWDAARVEAKLQLRAVLGALRAGQADRAATLLETAVNVLRPSHLSAHGPLQGALALALDDVLSSMTLGEVEAISACGPKPTDRRTNEPESHWNVLARCIADALFQKRLGDARSSYSPAAIESMVRVASPDALRRLQRSVEARDAVPTPAQTQARALAVQLGAQSQRNVGSAVFSGLRLLAEGQLDGMLRDYRVAAGAWALRPGSDVEKTVTETLRSQSGQLADLSADERRSLAEWFASEQFASLKDLLGSFAADPQADARWKTVLTMLKVTKDVLFSAAPDAASGPAIAALGSAAPMAQFRTRASAALASLGYSGPIQRPAEARLDERAKAQITDMDQRFRSAPMGGFGITHQAARDMVSGSHRIQVDDAPAKRLQTESNFTVLKIYEGGQDEPSQTLDSGTNLGYTLGAQPELVKKALYFATQEVIAIFEAPLTRDEDSPVVRAMGTPVNFLGAPDLSYSISIAGDTATVAIDYSRSEIRHLAIGDMDVIAMDPAQTYLRLTAKLEVSLHRPTRLLPGATTLDFRLVRAAEEPHGEEMAVPTAADLAQPQPRPAAEATPAAAEA